MLHQLTDVVEQVWLCKLGTSFDQRASTDHCDGTVVAILPRTCGARSLTYRSRVEQTGGCFRQTLVEKDFGRGAAETEGEPAAVTVVVAVGTEPIAASMRRLALNVGASSRAKRARPVRARRTVARASSPARRAFLAPTVFRGHENLLAQADVPHE